MPEVFSQLNIISLAILSAIIVSSAVVVVVGVTKSRRYRAARIVAFIFDWIVVAMGVFYALTNVLRFVDGMPVSINPDFTILLRGENYSVPVISELFAEITIYSLFSVVGGAAFVLSTAAIVVQLVSWHAIEKERKNERIAEAELVKREDEEMGGLIEKVGDDADTLLKSVVSGREGADVKVTRTDEKKLEDEIVASFSPDSKPELLSIEEENECLRAIRPENIEVKSDRKSRVKVIRGRTIVKSDAATAYKQFLRERDGLNGEDE